MSVFAYPRVNFKGGLRLSPGTANNDDYAQPGSGQALLPDSFGPYAGQPLGLIDSKQVEAKTFGMSDDDFLSWIQKAQTFDTPSGETVQIVPAEWNYYGDMSSSITQATVIGVQTGPETLCDRPDPEVPLSDVLGAQLKFSGVITDVNSEGSPPATQFFIDDLTLGDETQSWIRGAQVSKGVGLWINFFRNVTQVADNGSGTYVYHVLRGGSVDLPGFDGPGVVGVILRYYLALPLLDNPETANLTVLEKFYEEQKINPKTLEIVGTFAPLFEDETITAAPVGRQLISRQQNIPTPGLINNGQGNGVALAPAVIQQIDQRITADFLATFPDRYDEQTQSNPKFDFGEVSLIVAAGESQATVGPVDYADTAGGDRRGWLFDFDISSNEAAQKILASSDATFHLEHSKLGRVLDEVDYYVVSDQLAVYGEQGGSNDHFVNQGSPEEAKVSVFHRGQRLGPADSPPITLWQYRSVPIQEPGNVVKRTDAFRPGEAITVDTKHPGNYLFTFSVAGETNPPPDQFPPESYADFAYPPGAFVVTWAPSISLRLLPNGDDFSRYLVDPSAPEPIGNDQLTFDVLFEKVLRVYYLLYPSMNKVFPLNSESAVKSFAGAILERTSQTLWLTSAYMPRTRDLSRSRRTLLQAWCRKVLKESE